MRCDTESGWTHDAHADSFYADKNVNVVLPIGGQSSFYSDWLKPDNGHNYQWETFLTKELPPLLESQWRTTNVRGIAGLVDGRHGRDVPRRTATRSSSSTPPPTRAS